MYIIIFSEGIETACYQIPNKRFFSRQEQSPFQCVLFGILTSSKLSSHYDQKVIYPPKNGMEEGKKYVAMFINISPTITPLQKKKKLQHRPFCFHSSLYRHQHVVIKNITSLADNGRSICNRRGFMKYEILAEQLITKQ